MIEPNLSDIVLALDDLATMPSDECLGSYVAGYLIAVVRVVAEVHEGEAHQGDATDPFCGTCCWIRAGLGMLAALDLDTEVPVEDGGGV